MPNNKNYKNLDDIFVIGKSDLKSGDFDTIVFVSRNVKNVIIPPFIKIINSYSFSCLQIERISIPSNVTVIGKGAFQYCKKLEKIEIPSNSKIKKIEKYAFLNCQFRSILIPSNASIYIDDFNYNKLQVIEFSDYLDIINIEKELFGQPFNAIVMVPQKRK